MAEVGAVARALVVPADLASPGVLPVRLAKRETAEMKGDIFGETDRRSNGIVFSIFTPVNPVPVE